MQFISSDRIFSISSRAELEALSLEIFRYQAKHCKVYGEFVRHLGVDAEKVVNYDEIPFLPIEFFKSHQVLSSSDPVMETFSSSGTTGMTQSKHPVTDINLYLQSFRRGFELFYGNPGECIILALLPSYLEREGSSLIYMVDDLIRESGDERSGYFLYDHKRLYDVLLGLKNSDKNVVLIGVTYALLDFAESHSLDFPDLIVMETGGMKGKRKELVREELHQTLCAGFGVPMIHSEYGMTELLSQAYSKGAGRFHCPPWINIAIRHTNDPLQLLPAGSSGGINVTDLANLNSCSFIATQDLGRLHDDGSFEILGRFDNSDIRGCNLLVT